MNNLLIFSFLLLLISFHRYAADAQSALAPGPAGPPNITAILEKSGQYTTCIRLLKATQVANQINTQLNNSNQGLTLFAPTDNAFNALKPGTLNSLTDQEKVSLVQFHVLPSFISVSQFQTVSNPVRTQAGSGSNGQYPLNVTISGNQVNITTGVSNATVANTIYSDGQLAVYQVDQVLLPLDLFGPKAPAPAPAPAASKSKKKGGDSGSGSSSDDGSADASGVGGRWVGRDWVGSVMVAAVVGFWL